MSVHILTIPFDPEKEIFQDEDLTDFLLNKKIKTLRPEFFQLNGRAYWTVFVEYKTILDDKVQAVKMSQSKALNDAQKLLFQRFREWRKEKAKKNGVPVFIIATNSELIEVVKRNPSTMEALRQIHGFGKKKVEQHGKDILNIIKAFYEKKTIRPDASKSKQKLITEIGL
ncbi:HRDC domain-containing protein [Candidatus Magnetomoraceae bacterium gMMP-15]